MTIYRADRQTESQTERHKDATTVREFAVYFTKSH